MIKAIIVEDEILNIKNLQKLLNKYCKEVVVVATASDAGEAISVIRQYKPQLVFLDIQLAGKDGFEMLQELKYYDFELIFVTAFSEYGIQAVKFSAIDYLLKPIEIKELQLAVEKATRKIYQKQENKNLQNLLHYLQHRKKEDHKIAINSLKEIKLITVSDIIRCESDNSYTYFFLADGEKILSTTPINVYEEMLSDYGFIRCHQSHLVNKKYVKSFLKTEGYALLMEPNNVVPVSRNKKEEIKSFLIDIRK